MKEDVNVMIFLFILMKTQLTRVSLKSSSPECRLFSWLSRGKECFGLESHRPSKGEKPVKFLVTCDSPHSKEELKSQFTPDAQT